MSYVGRYHKLVAQIDLGIYNWKQHSTGYLLKMWRDYKFYSGWQNDSELFWLSENPDTAHTRDIYWYQEWRERVKKELDTRPHQTTKKERNKKLPKENSSGIAARKRSERLKAFFS